MHVIANIASTCVTLGLAYWLVKLAIAYGKVKGMNTLLDTWDEKVKAAKATGGLFDQESEAFWCGLNAGDLLMVEATALAAKRLGLRVVKKPVVLSEKDL